MSVQAIAAVLERSQSRLGARLVMLALANHQTDRGCSPSLETIAREARLSVRQVQRCLRQLEALGEVRIERRSGDVNHYVLFPPGQDVTPTPDIPGPEMSPHQAQDVTPTPDISGPETSSEHKKHKELDIYNKALDIKLDRELEPREIYPPLESFGLFPPPMSPPRPAASIDALFEEFYRIYPRHEGRRKARQAFERALKRAPFAEILQGALRYRNDPNRDPSFTAHPATWLNRDGWEDDPLPPRRAGPTPIHPVDQARLAAMRERARKEAEHGARGGAGTGGGDLRSLPGP